MNIESSISIIIPNYNGEATIGECLEAAFSSRYQNFEVIVVDDFSRDNSMKIIEKYPCRMIRLDKHSGASKARNVGAKNSNGEILFFIDADCLLYEGTLDEVNRIFFDGKKIVGGTYTKIPYDNNFFSAFQSIFINYSETKHKDAPDYIATHAMAIDSRTFRETGGFREGFFMPILEDVEFSHRLRRSGYKLVINPLILVRHIFNFTFLKSLRNAARKSMYWTIYSIKNSDLLIDSGTASLELKADVLLYFLIFLSLLFVIFAGKALFLTVIPLLLGINIYISKKLIKEFYETKGLLFTIAAVFYYTAAYPLGVGAGVFAGILIYMWKKIRGRTE